MDLGGERVVSDSVKYTREVLALVDDDDNLVEAVAVTGNDVDSSGWCVNERLEDRIDSRDLADEGNLNEERLACSLYVNSASPSASGGSAPKKGHGLKKWKRIRRGDRVTHFSPGLDNGKAMKRNVSRIDNSSSQFPHTGEENQATGDFLRPVNELDNNLEGLSYLPALASSSTVVTLGAVSENSEDQSSKSSTAASAPRHGIGKPLGSPLSGDKKKPKNPNGKGLRNPTQVGKTGKGRADPCKKLRGERVKYEKEISHSSLESDLRSSNFDFLQTSNRRLSEASINHSKESDEDVPGEPHFSDHQIGYSQRNARGTEDISPHDLGAGFSWEGNEENDGSHQPPTRRDPLVDSIRTLDYVREALEKELLKFKEIGKCYNSFADTVNSFDYVNGEDLSQNALGFIDLAEKITYLESKLEESSDAIKMKELEVGNLEASLRSASLHNGDMNNKSLEQEKTGKLELELEILFAQRVEGDVKYIATANALEDAKHAVAKSETLLIDQKALEEKHLPVRTRLDLNECKVWKIKRHAKDLERAVTAGSISKLTWYSLSQLLMLLVTLWAVYLRIISDSAVVVPT